MQITFKAGLALIITFGTVATIAACSGTDMTSSGNRRKSDDGNPNPASTPLAEEGGGPKETEGNPPEQTGGEENNGGWDSDFLSAGNTNESDLGGGGLTPNNDTGSGAGGIIVDEGELKKLRSPKFGLLVNKPQCAFCHTRVNGDVASTTDVPALWVDSVADIKGGWYIAGAYNATTSPHGASVKVAVETSIKTGVKAGDTVNDPARLMPKDLDGNGASDFPVINFAELDSKMTGRVKTTDVDFNKVYEGNLVLIGTEKDPIRVVGEVLIKGDLVIKGWYAQSIGNIYVTGNVYIPADLRAKKTPFPYPTDPAAALERARKSLADKDDALGIATPGSIIISDFESHTSPPSMSVFEHPQTPPEDQPAGLGLKTAAGWTIHSWFPGGKTAFDGLFEPEPVSCVRPYDTPADNNRSFSRVDAFLYAQRMIGGRANRNSYSLNGGVIADNFHIIAAAAYCPTGTHPVHQQDQKWNYVNYDYRMKAGLLLIKQIGQYFGE